ncbi:MAG: hypothetical protein H7838_04920 [Magnetococcus sp. DMHC-8]
MKIALCDANLLNGLRPLEFAAYLRSTGWTRQDSVAGQWATWVKDDDYEILLPLQQGFRDFALRMSEALRVLEQVENRSQWMIFNDLQMTGVDLIRVCLMDQDLSDGSLSMDENVKIAQYARDMMLAAASSAIRPQAVWPTRCPAQAVDYLKGVRIGQSERGSYVLTIQSRVTPLLQPTQGVLDLEEPFPRQVVERLSHGLATMLRAAEQSATEGVRVFDAAIAEGVSANLCDAVVGLAGNNEERSRRMHISFSWSRNRPTARHMPALIAFPADRIPFIAEAARLLRANAPVENFDLQGPVVKLERQEGQEKGRVTILGFVEAKPRKIAMCLEDHQYNIAIAAHRQQQTISCSGTLTKVGRGFELQSVHSLQADME